MIPTKRRAGFIGAFSRKIRMQKRTNDQRNIFKPQPIREKK
jgi:hypothetical protein